MNATDDSLDATMTHDHRACDELWTDVESAADLDATRAVWGRFRDALVHHLAFEEASLFPAFEAVMGFRGGPTEVMRAEHERIRALLGQMEICLDEEDTDGLLDQGDTLFMLIQQHNMKEEQVLYPMMTQALGDDWAQLRQGFAR